MLTWTNARNNGWQTTADSRLTGVPGINDLIGGPEIGNDQADDNKPGEPITVIVHPQTMTKNLKTVLIRLTMLLLMQVVTAIGPNQKRASFQNTYLRLLISRNERRSSH